MFQRLDHVACCDNYCVIILALTHMSSEGIVSLMTIQSIMTVTCVMQIPFLSPYYYLASVCLLIFLDNLYLVRKETSRVHLRFL